MSTPTNCFVPFLAALSLPAALVADEKPMMTLDTASSMVASDRFGAQPLAQGSDGRYAWFMTVGVGAAKDRDPGAHADLYFTLSTFLAKELEFQFEFNGWYFQQPGDDTCGAGLSFVARWHVWHGAFGETNTEAFDWTVYLDLGIGFIASGDDVPPSGTSFNLAPRVGIGATFRLGENESRLVAGVRWHHMSNARITGDDNNPDFNAPLLYVGVQWPFR